MPMNQTTKNGVVKMNVPTTKDFGMSHRCYQMHKHNQSKKHR